MADENLNKLRGFAEAFARAPVAALEAASIALNEGAAVAERLGRAQILDELKLEDTYVRKNLYVDKESSRTDLLARIRANPRPVLAPRFGAEQKTTSASSDSRYLKGDPLRGIPEGRKAAGSTAWGVKQGGAGKAWKNAFFVKLKTSGAWAMVARQGQGAGLGYEDDWSQNLKVIHGPSVDQAWKGVRDDVAPAAMDHASEIFLAEFEKRIQ